MSTRRKIRPTLDHISTLADLVVSDERARYIQEILHPEAEYRGRPGLFAASLGTQPAERKMKSEDKVHSDGECEEPSMDSLAAD